MNIIYVLKEGISGFSRARLSTLASIFTITISLILLGSFTIIYLNMNRIVQALRDRVEMEAFLEEPLPQQSTSSIEKHIRLLPGVDHTRFISKDDAARIFKQEFGEDIKNVLDFNPLPPSFKIYLEDAYKNSDSTKILVQSLKRIAGINQVIYRKTLLELLDQRSKVIAAVGLGIGIALTIASIFLVSNTIRLAIYAKRKIIDTMKLVGATRMFIRVPFIVEGLAQGLIGGFLSAAITMLVMEYATRLLSSELSDFFQVDPLFYLLMLMTGTVLGFLGSLISVRKFISENVGTA